MAAGEPWAVCLVDPMISSDVQVYNHWEDPPAIMCLVHLAAILSPLACAVVIKCCMAVATLTPWLIPL